MPLKVANLQGSQRAMGQARRIMSHKRGVLTLSALCVEHAYSVPLGGQLWPET
jgi:hypothetical protein